MQAEGDTRLDAGAATHNTEASTDEASDEGKRKSGRKPKQEQEAKKATMLAIIREHASLKENHAELARMVGTSVSTIRRWLDIEEQRWNETRNWRAEQNEEDEE